MVFVSLRRCVACLLLILLPVLSACQPPEDALPTTIVLGATDEPAADAATATPAPLPTETPIPTPEAFLGRFATDTARLAGISALHAAPGSGPVDLYISNTNLTRGLAFRQDTGRVNILSGEYIVRAMPPGLPPGDGALATTTIRIAPGQSLRLLFSGTVDALALTTFTENTGPLGPGQARLTFIHAVPRAPDAAPSFDEIAIAPAVTFGQASSGLLVPVGTAALGMRDDARVFASRPVALRERTSYTLVLVGDPADDASFELLAYETQVAGRASARVINLLTDNQPVDVWLDDTPLATGIETPRASERRDITTDARRVQVYPAGADRANTSALLELTLAPNLGDNLSLVLVGDVGTPQLVPVTEDLSATRPEYARFTFVHAQPGTPLVRLGVGSGLRDDVPDLAYARFSPPVWIEQGANRFFFSDFSSRSEGEIVEQAEDFIVEAGRSYLYLMTGRRDAPPIAFSEVVGIDEALGRLALGESPLAALDQPRVRLINALDQPFTLSLVVDNSLSLALGYGQGSTLIPLQSDLFQLSVQAQETGQLLRADTVALPLASTYTLLIYGDVSDVNFLLIPDPRELIVVNGASLRLINMTRDQQHLFRLARSPATDPMLGGITGDPETWPTLPFSIDTAIPSVSGLSASTFIYIAPEPQDMVLIDIARGRIAQLVRGYPFVEGQHYDLVAYEVSTGPTAEVRALMIPYPAP